MKEEDDLDDQIWPDKEWFFFVEATSAPARWTWSAVVHAKNTQEALNKVDAAMKKQGHSYEDYKVVHMNPV